MVLSRRHHPARTQSRVAALVSQIPRPYRPRTAITRSPTLSLVGIETIPGDDSLRHRSDAARLDGIDLDAGTAHNKQISETVIHTCDFARAMGFDYHPPPVIERRVLTTLQEPPRLC